MPASFWELAGTFLTVLTPLVAVPLTVITFHLRSLGAHQTARHAELLRRCEAAEGLIADLRRTVAEFQRDYTTKEEWLRECLHARRLLEQLSETTVRLETTLSGMGPGRNPAAEARHPSRRSVRTQQARRPPSLTRRG